MACKNVGLFENQFFLTKCNYSLAAKLAITLAVIFSYLCWAGSLFSWNINIASSHLQKFFKIGKHLGRVFLNSLHHTIFLTKSFLEKPPDDCFCIYGTCLPSKHFNIVFRLIWRHDVAQRQINVETTLCTSTLKFTTLNSMESMLSISKLIWTTLENFETTFSFSTQIFTTLGNVETTLWIWPFEKKN